MLLSLPLMLLLLVLLWLAERKTERENEWMKMKRKGKEIGSKNGQKGKEKVCTKAEKESHHYQSIFNFQITFNATTSSGGGGGGGGSDAITSCVCVSLVTKSTHSISIWLDVRWSIYSARHLPSNHRFVLMPKFLRYYHFSYFVFHSIGFVFFYLLLLFVQFALLLPPLCTIHSTEYTHLCLHGWFFPVTEN